MSLETQKRIGPHNLDRYSFSALKTDENSQKGIHTEERVVDVLCKLPQVADAYRTELNGYEDASMTDIFVNLSNINDYNITGLIRIQVKSSPRTMRDGRIKILKRNKGITDIGEWLAQNNMVLINGGLNGDGVEITEAEIITQFNTGLDRIASLKHKENL